MKFTFVTEIKDEYLTEPRIDTTIEMLKYQSEQVKQEFYKQALDKVNYLRRWHNGKKLPLIPKK